MLSRKTCDWRIVGAFSVCLLIFVSIHLSVYPADNHQASSMYRHAVINTGDPDTLPSTGDEMDNCIIEIETQKSANDRVKTIISIVGKLNNVRGLTDKILDKIREIMSNDANEPAEEIENIIAKTKEQNTNGTQPIKTKEQNTNGTQPVKTKEQNTNGTQPIKTMEQNTNGMKPTFTTDQILDELDSFDETIVLPKTLKKLREKLKCFDKGFESRVSQRGDYWVFTNYIRAEHGPLACHEELTLTTHSDFTFLDNLDTLIERWNGPVSVALHTPGTDLTPTIDTMRYIRDCLGNANLVRKWVTFHVYFHKDHMPPELPRIDELLGDQYNCSLPKPYSVNASTLYSANKSLLYPVNVGRNIARDAALTHFIFAVDIELYPSPHLGARFLNMIARDPPELAGTNPRVFPVVLFEVEEDEKVPMNKTQLLVMLNTKKAIPFHNFVCPACHNVPKAAEWMSQNDTGQLNVFTVGKRTGSFRSWEPIFIGTNQEPMYEERLSWQGKSDKMTQSFTMCVQDYDYMMLNDAFLVHRPGIKHYKPDSKRDAVVSRTNSLIHNTISKELKTVYGTKEGCNV